MHRSHGLISTSGIFGIAPAANADEIDFEIVGVETHRHVEQKSRRHRRSAPGYDRARNVTTPVVASQRERRASALSTPPTATRTLPATGFAIGAR